MPLRTHRTSLFSQLLKPVLLIPILLLPFASSAAELSHGSPESVGMSSDVLDGIDKVTQSYIEDGQLQGIVTMVARHGKVVHTSTYGKLDIESGAAMKEDSLFRIYSMTKPIVTTAAMQLYEQGKFQLTDPVSKYLPAFKDTKVLVDGKLVDPERPLTIQMLMTHTGGIVYDFIGNSEVVKMYQASDLRSAKNTEEFVDKLAKLPLQQQPGTRWVYSFSIDVLGRLVEVVSGEPLDLYLKNHILDPLEMSDTFFEVPANKVSRFGTNHQFDEDGKLTIIDRPADSAYTKKVTFFSGGGGMVSTADDYMRFCQMLLNGGNLDGVQILSRKTVDYMTRDHTQGIFANSPDAEPGRPGFGFGLGFAITMNPELSGVIGSAGEYYWSGVAGTIFWIDPVEDMIVISMIQQRSSRVPLRESLKAITYGSLETH